MISLLLRRPAPVRGAPPDGPRLRQVVDNLLANVRSHTPPGTTTTVTVATDQTAAFIEVADTGPGLTEEQASKVFERFYRIRNESDPPGVGLGLAIAKGIVEAHASRGEPCCYGNDEVIELEPGYVDVAIRRWQTLTGGSARHAESGRTFSELEAERPLALGNLAEGGAS